MDHGPFAVGVPMEGLRKDAAPLIEGRKWRDVWAAVIYLIHLVIVGFVCIFYGTYSLAHHNSTSPGTHNVRRWLPQLGAVILLAGGFSVLWLFLVKRFPIKMITFVLWAGVVLCLILGSLILISRRDASGLASGLIFLFLALMQALFAYRVRPRIPFAAALIQKSMMVTLKYPAVYMLSCGAVFVSLICCALWVTGTAGVISVSNGSAVLWVFLMLVSLAWTMEVIKNTVHVGVAGTVATHYFHQQNMPQNPTKESLHRACTTSFGSICLGSVLVAIVEGIRMFFQSLSGQCNEFLLCCILCILNGIDQLVRFFNRWAYVQVAVYGKGFVTAAKDTWSLLKANGCDVLINDDLTGIVLWVGSVFGGGLCSVFGGLLTYFSFSHGMAISVAVLSFFVGYFITNLSTAVVHSAVATYYVCFAENPATLHLNDPEFYNVLWTRQRELQG